MKRKTQPGAAAGPLPTEAAALRRAFGDAVRDHQLPQIVRCLDADPSLANAAIGEFGARPVVVAGGHLPTIDLLLARGADINLKSDWWAGGFGVLDIDEAGDADALIARGATVDVFAAARLNRLDRLKALLAADPALVHAKGGDGGRPLHFATSAEGMDLLLAGGAAIDARDVDHESTAAQWAMPRPPGEHTDAAKQDRNRQRMRWLVDRGAATDVFMLAALGDVSRLTALLSRDPMALEVRTGGKDYPPCPDAPGRHIYIYALNEGRSAYEVAMAFGSAACAALLLARSTPRQRFLAACATGDAAVAHATRREHPNVMADLLPEDHRAVANAAWGGDSGAVVLMLDLGFDPAAMPGTAASALHCAAWHGRAEMVGTMLNHSAIRPRWAELVALREGAYQSTPLEWCCHGSTNCRNPRGDYAAVALRLLEAGAKIGPNAGDASPAVRRVVDQWAAAT